MIPSRRFALRFIICAVAYSAGALHGLQFAVVDAVTLIWISAGVGMAAVIAWGRWMVLPIILAEMAFCLANGDPLRFILFAATSVAAQALIGELILRRSGFRFFERGTDVLLLFIAAGVACSVGAAIGTLGMLDSRMVEGTDALSSLIRWGFGDFTGVLAVAPAFLAFTAYNRTRLRPFSATRIFEAAALLLLLLLAGFFVFFQREFPGAPVVTSSLLLWPLIVFVAYRFGVLGAACTNILLASMVVAGRASGVGPFASGTPDDAMYLGSTFIIATTVTGFTLGAAVSVRDRSEASLRESLDWLDMIQASAGVGIWNIDLDSDRGRVSTPMARSMGVSKSNANSMIGGLLKRVHPDDQDDLVRTLERTRAFKEPANMTFRVTAHDGRVRSHSLWASVLPIDSKRPNGPFRMVGVTFDVTEQRNLEEAMMRNERLASLGTFVAGLAHDLNNPLGGIILAAETARHTIEAPTEISQALDDIIDDSGRAARIVKSVLQFAKADSAERQSHDLNSSIRNAVELSRTYASGRGVTIETNLLAEPLIIKSNEIEIEQLFVNLLRNAAEACDTPGEIRVTTQRNGDCAKIDIQDNGRGMTESEVRHAFDPFFTTRAKEGGSGLGLSICHGVVTAHGGKIRIRSRVSAGTTVEVEFSSEAGDSAC